MNRNADPIQKIQELRTDGIALDIRYMAEADSTNKMLCEAARKGEKDTVLLIAETQTAGRGRFERRFFSPAGTGIYMSLLLHPTCSPALFPLITPLAGAAAAEAMESLSGERVGIKWVNDLYKNGKKIAGILAESGFYGDAPYLVLGIGINAYMPQEMPEELRSIAGAVWKEKTEDQRPALIAAFLERFFAYYAALPEKAFLDSYRAHSILIGKTVSVHNAAFDTAKTGEGQKALCIGIDENAALLVRYEDGKTDVLSAGEVTLSL